MIALLVTIFTAVIVAGVVNKDIHLIVGGGFMLLSCCVVFAAMGISSAINNETDNEK